MIKFELLLGVLFFQLLLGHGAVPDDKITGLPGLTFDPGFTQYSGYLSTPSGNQLHYWLVESQSNPENDPLVVWLNGGPGCSSLIGLFEELGPFRVNPDGSTLFENIFSWNKEANVLFLESPRGVGFSYHDNSTGKDDGIYNDNLTAIDNADALEKFFELYPEYIGRPLYLTGESYAGVYLPTLTYLLIQRIIAGTLFGVNLRGLAIGNGIFSEYYQMDSVVNLLYYRGIFGKDWYEGFRQCCRNLSGTEMLSSCEFRNFISINSSGIYYPRRFPDDPFMQQCADKVKRMIDVENRAYTINDPYDLYQDCYDDKLSPPSLRAQKMANFLAKPPNSLMGSGPNSFVDEGARVNIWSTDAQYTYPCYMDRALLQYLNMQSVRKALHIPQFVPRYAGCSDYIAKVYEKQYLDTESVFQEIINSGYPLRILIYNGDTDTVCDFLGDEWFVMDLAAANDFEKSKRSPWFYQQKSEYLPQIAGYQQNFSNEDIHFDLLTVKGAGHFVPLDRGGPALQMITNFIKEQNYSILAPYSIQRKPILPEYQPPAPKQLTRKEEARIWNLPGVTYPLNFKQYSGYLHGVTGNYLHYWFVESQRNPTEDPLILWLNGGPGCSSLGGLFTELGPFHPNPDGLTLFENVFSWNKGANVLFLESPRNVGFSYQNTSENLDPGYNDLKSTRDNYLAIMDFLTVFPEYKGRPFYITGESYGGIYVPTLAAYCIERIQNGEAKDLNLKGMAVGNGELSMNLQLDSILSMLYYRGAYGYDLYRNITNCSTNKSIPAAYFDFSSLVTIYSAGTVIPKDLQSYCGNLMVDYGANYIWRESWIQDVYNINQDCYQRYLIASGLRMAQLDLKARKKKRAENAATPVSSSYIHQTSPINYESTDGQAGFYCYASLANKIYLQQADVRAALHIPSNVQEWADCSSLVNFIYDQQHIQMTDVFQQIINSHYPFDILIYNGDTDLACEFLGDEWFIENLAMYYNMRTVQSWSPWYHLSQIAGYWKRFQYSNSTTIDFMTVKGAGHFVPMDRPGPALQMITNFIARKDYSTMYPYDTKLAPLQPQYELLQKIIVESTQRTVSKVSKTKPRIIKRTAIPSNADDQIQNLPAISFVPKFSQYSGYLQADSTNSVFYWFIESRNDQPVATTTNPILVVWLGDGPGCSPIAELFRDFGPYRFKISSDGAFSLEQNPYSWNQAASFLILETPAGVGYTGESAITPNDTATAQLNKNALKKFYEKFTNYEKSQLFIGGRGYGSVAALKLAELIFQDSAMKQKPVGILLENGMLSRRDQINSLPNLMYFSALIGKAEWDRLIKCCTTNGVYDNDCNLAKYVIINEHGKVSSDGSECGNTVMELSDTLPQQIMDGNEHDNFYESCYITQSSIHQRRRQKRQAYHFESIPLVNNVTFINQAQLLNYLSTDPFASYPCYMNEAIQSYLGTTEVRNALHVDSSASAWQICNPTIQQSYVQQYPKDTSAIFNSLFAFASNTGQPLRFLVYNGDAGLANNFIANQWFIERLAAGFQKSPHQFWKFTQSPKKYQIQYAGYQDIFTKGPVKINLLVVKGAGRYIALDRPLPTLQMFTNFLKNESFGTQITYLPNQPSAVPATPPPQISPREAAKIYNLPGLTYQINFTQYSGYLNASKGNYLFYWYTESQIDPDGQPLIVWFNGGPGCSSVSGLLLENGPFRPNPDGRTLWENVYSWNKMANVLFIDSPRQVGFSYQDKTVNTDNTWNDEKTASDALNALLDFFTIFPELKTKELYIAGESYGGVYVPMLTNVLLQYLQEHPDYQLNFQGIMLGNGYVSQKLNIRSLPDFLYFIGIFGRDEWDELSSHCCPNSTDGLPKFECNYDQYVDFKLNGLIEPKPTGDRRCGKLVTDMTWNWVEQTLNDAYNVYQDCYRNFEPIFGFPPVERFQKLLKTSNLALQARPNIRMVHTFVEKFVYSFSTDHVGGFMCYSVPAVAKYLSQTHVREALHVPSYVQEWSMCSEDVGKNYSWQHADMTEVFQQIYNKLKALNRKFRMLVYNGDVDTACPILEAQWFFDQFAQNYRMTNTSRDPWYYRISNDYEPQIGGYLREFKDNNLLTITVATVKGAGHMVPIDRAGPMAQLLNNFLINKADWNKTFPYSHERKPLIAPYTNLPPETTLSTAPKTSGASTAGPTTFSTGTAQSVTTVTATAGSTTKKPKGCRSNGYTTGMLLLILLSHAFFKFQFF